MGAQVTSVITQAARAARELDERMKQAGGGGFPESPIVQFPRVPKGLESSDNF